MGLYQGLHWSPHDWEATRGNEGRCAEAGLLQGSWNWSFKAQKGPSQCVCVVTCFCNICKSRIFSLQALTTTVFFSSDFPSAVSSYSDFPCPTSRHAGDMMLEFRTKVSLCWVQMTFNAGFLIFIWFPLTSGHSQTVTSRLGVGRASRNSLCCQNIYE